MTSKEELNQYSEQIISFYGPQLGELVWHSINVDDRITSMSELHADEILLAAQHCRPIPDTRPRPIRILEVGAYAHYGAHKAASSLGGVSVAHDISPSSLRVGLERAKAAGIADIEAMSTLVAGDFHNLPFNTGYFDVVFCASSVHHTYRPREVINEMLRVIRKGGVLYLQNEPVGRIISFYGFSSNRHDQFTEFEAELNRRGSLLTLASPFPGARPERLFGMTENEHIPLDLILETLTKSGEIVHCNLTPQVGDFENKILAMADAGDEDLETSLATFLLGEIQAVKPMLTERDLLLGIKLPEINEIWQLSYRAAPELRKLVSLSDHEREHQIARLFGAALQAIVVKTRECQESKELFRRELFIEAGVFNDLPSLPGICLQLSAQVMPGIEDRDLTALANIYTPEDWEAYHEEIGIRVFLNLNPRCRIILPSQPSPAILLLRFFAVEGPRPYRVNLYLKDETLLSSLIVTQSESLLFREVVQEYYTEVFLETGDLSYKPMSLPRHIRVMVCRLIPIKFSAKP